MQPNKDHLIGILVGIIIVAVALWGYNMTTRLTAVERAHNNLVAVLTQPKQQPQQMAPKISLPTPQPEQTDASKTTKGK